VDGKKNAITRVPVLISATDAIKEGHGIVAETVQVLSEAGVDLKENQILELLSNASIHLLIDGLDEVRSDQRSEIIREIEKLRRRFSNLQMVVTCRTAIYEYWLSGFAIFEIARFSEDEVFSFVKNWYKMDSDRSRQLISQITGSPRILEMCSNPLLATVMCIAFDDGVEISNNRAEVYKEAIDTLLKKWDASRDVFRENEYALISIKRRHDLLADLAMRIFDGGNVVFGEQLAIEIVGEFLMSSPEFSEFVKSENLADVLTAIESQHGLLVKKSKSNWSFAHLTFQEYFVAVYATSRDQDIRARIIDRAFDDPDWHEVITIIASLLPNADDFVIDFLKQLKRLNFSSEFIRKLDNQIFRAMQSNRYKRETLEKVVSNKSKNSSIKLPDKTYLKLIDGGKNFDTKEISSLLKTWKMEASIKFELPRIDISNLIALNIYSLVRELKEFLPRIEADDDEDRIHKQSSLTYFLLQSYLSANSISVSSLESILDAGVLHSLTQNDDQENGRVR